MDRLGAPDRDGEPETELELYFQEVTDHLITRAMGSDGDDSNIGRR